MLAGLHFCQSTRWSSFFPVMQAVHVSTRPNLMSRLSESFQHFLGIKALGQQLEQFETKNQQQLDRIERFMGGSIEHRVRQQLATLRGRPYAETATASSPKGLLQILSRFECDEEVRLNWVEGAQPQIAEYLAQAPILQQGVKVLTAKLQEEHEDTNLGPSSRQAIGEGCANCSEAAVNWSLEPDARHTQLLDQELSSLQATMGQLQTGKWAFPYLRAYQACLSMHQKGESELRAWMSSVRGCSVELLTAEFGGVAQRLDFDCVGQITSQAAGWDIELAEIKASPSGISKAREQLRLQLQVLRRLLQILQIGSRNLQGFVWLGDGAGYDVNTRSIITDGIETDVRVLSTSIV